MLGTSQENEAYYLMETYNVSYVYVSKAMYDLPSSDGIITYMPFDTHFKTIFVSGDASVYQYIPNPTLKSPSNELNINSTNNAEYKKSIEPWKQFIPL